MPAYVRSTPAHPCTGFQLSAINPCPPHSLQCVLRVSNQLAKKGSAAMYGMVASIPDKALIDDFIISFFSEVFTPSKQ